MTGTALDKDGQNSAHTVEAAAAYWAARMDAAPDAHDPALDAWLKEHPAHTGALLRAQAMLYMVSQQNELLLPEESRAPQAPAPMAAAVAATMDATGGRGLWRWAGAGLAASALIAGCWVLAVQGRSYQTDTGEMRRIALQDGSAITMDAQSGVDVDLGRAVREVRLTRGRALFRVAHDAARPFRVIAGDVTITDIGTVFAINQNGDAMTVLVSEGEVDIATAGRHWRLGAGQRFSLAPGRPVVAETVAAPAIERALAWTSGRFDLDGDTVAYALADMNRHNHRQIRLADPALGREKLYGAFRLDDPEGFARAVALGLGAPMAHDGEDIVIGAK